MTETESKAEQKRPRVPLGASYWKLWSASVVSNLRDGVAFIAYPWLASAVTRNAVLIALIAVAQRLPWLVFTLPAGVITDRVDRRKIMVAMNVFRTALTVAVALIVCLAFATLAALAISRFRFKGRKSFVLTIILVQMLPAEAMFIAQYKMISGLGLLNSLAGVSIIYVAMVVPFTIWMLRGFVSGVPIDLEEAAMVDGCTRLGAFRRITFPLIAPGLVASGVFAFIQVWNEFALASVLLTDDEVQTLPLWLRDIAQQSNLGAPEWGQIMAGSVLVAVPVIIFFVIVQGRMAQGLVGGAVKG